MTIRETIQLGRVIDPALPNLHLHHKIAVLRAAVLILHRLKKLRIQGVEVSILFHLKKRLVDRKP